MEKEISKLKFEEALSELEETVSQLQDGDVDLEESTKLYERGVLLKKHCDNLLNNTKMKVEKITKEANGTHKTEKFE